MAVEGLASSILRVKALYDRVDMHDLVDQREGLNRQDNGGLFLTQHRIPPQSGLAPAFGGLQPKKRRAPCPTKGGTCGVVDCLEGVP